MIKRVLTSLSLYEAIPNRHTNRGPYERERDLSSDLEQQFAALIAGDEDVEIALYSNAGQIEMWRRIIVEATEAIIADETMVHDSERWFRHPWDAIQTHRDGPTLDAAGLSPMMTRIAKFLPRPSAESNHQYWLDATRDVQVATAPAFGVILVPELYDRARSLQAGRVWQRLHLWATAQGLAMQPLNQPVERVDRERQLGEPPSAARALAALIGKRNAKPTFAFRIGYPVRQAPVSPRRSLPQVLLS